MVTASWEGDHRKWYIVAYRIPDFGTQLHELSHDFLYFNYTGCEEYPWFKEGSGMYYESGAFAANGRLDIRRPMPEYHRLFLEWRARDRLIPLSRLITMKRDEFYREDYARTYSQSKIFYFYLMVRHRDVMARLYEHLNSQRITRNDQLVDFIVKYAGVPLAGMEREYIRYGEDVGGK